MYELKYAKTIGGMAQKLGVVDISITYRSVVDQNRVKGPILVTHTNNDKAVGVAYSLASRINGDTTAAFGDENDKFGGLGRNGAQQMEKDEVVKGDLLDATADYWFQAGKFFNLEGSAFIKAHGDVTGKEIAHAVRKAIGLWTALIGELDGFHWEAPDFHMGEASAAILTQICTYVWALKDSVL